MGSGANKEGGLAASLVEHHLFVLRRRSRLRLRRRCGLEVVLVVTVILGPHLKALRTLRALVGVVAVVDDSHHVAAVGRRAPRDGGLTFGIGCGGAYILAVYENSERRAFHRLAAAPAAAKRGGPRDRRAGVPLMIVEFETQLRLGGAVTTVPTTLAVLTARGGPWVST